MNLCESHEGKQILCYCLDPRCKNFPGCCGLCLKKVHNNCKDHFIVSIEEGTKRVNLIKNEQDPHLITKKLNQVLELKLYEMNKTLMNKKRGFMESFDIKDSPENVLDPQILPNVKKNFHLEKNKETNLIDISSKFNATEEQINESLAYFEKDVEKKILAFIDDFSKLRFTVRTGSIVADDWIRHEKIEIEDCPEGVHFKRKEGNSEFNYFCALYTQPLDTSCVFKVNVESVYESDRFVDVGIVPKSKFESLKSDFINYYGSGGISFCGYSYTGGLSGNSPTTTSSDGENGLKPGSHFYMRYEPGVEVKFYDDNGKVDLVKSMTGVTEDHYLFAVCYHPQVAYNIERIE